MKAFDIVFKDLKIVLSDKKALATMILMPIVLTTILGFALRVSFLDYSTTEKIKIGIVKKYDMNDDINRFKETLENEIINQNISKEDIKEINNSISEINLEKIFFSDYLGNEQLKKVIDYEILDEKNAVDKLENGEISAVVVLPENFIYDMYINFLTPLRNNIKIQVLSDPNKNLSGKITEELMKSFSNIISTMVITKNVFIETALEHGLNNEVYNEVETVINNVIEEVEGSVAKIQYERLEGKRDINSFSYYSASMTTMFILFAAALGSKFLLEEKDNFTYQRMIISDVSKWKIAVGKYFSVFMISMVQISIMIIFTTIVLRVNWGNIILVSIVSIFLSLSVAGLGTMLASLTYLFNNYKIANVFESVIIQVMALLGGSFVPIEFMPKFISGLGKFTINGVSLEAYLKVMMGYSFGEIMKLSSTLIVMSILFTVIAIIILEKGGESDGKYINVKTNEVA